MKLTGNTILITGGTSGLGLGLATALWKRNNTVIVTSRRQGAVDQVMSEHTGMFGYTVDVADRESVQSLADQILKTHPELNIVINSAGIMKAVDFFDEKSGLTDEIATNLTGTININKTFLPFLAGREEAAIINVSSGLSYLASTAHPIYSASKSGVNALTDAIRGQAAYFGYKGLRVIQVAPPLVSETNLNPTMHDNGESNPVNMKLTDFVKVVLKGMEKDKRIINPGPSKLLYLLGKFAPAKVKMKATRNTMVAEFSEKD